MQRSFVMRVEGNVYLCSVCGFGYDNHITAKECKNWCKTHKTCNLKLTKKAIKTPG